MIFSSSTDEQSILTSFRSQMTQEFKTSVSKLFPWLSISNSSVTHEMINEFYTFTYKYGSDDWSLRLEEGADNDEPQRTLYAFKLAHEFKFDGKDGRSSLSDFWRQLHVRVVCPLFKKAMSEDLNNRYISWPTKVYKLPQERVQEIWDSIYVNLSVSDDEAWVAEHFVRWIVEDKAHQLKMILESSKEVKTEQSVDIKNEESAVKNSDQYSTKESVPKKKIVNFRPAVKPAKKLIEE